MPFWRTIHSMPLGRGKHETIGFLARTHTRTCTHTHRHTRTTHTHTRACSHTFAYCDECHMGCILKWKWPAVIYIAKTTLTFDLCFICLLALHFHIFPLYQCTGWSVRVQIKETTVVDSKSMLLTRRGRTNILKGSNNGK